MMRLAQEIKYRARYFINDSYNYFWSLRLGIAGNEKMLVADMQTQAASKVHAQPYMTGWFRNLDRLLAPLKGQIHNHSFVDAGCGRGVMALYAARKYPFQSVSGFDFESTLINDAVKYKELSSAFSKVDFFVADACEHRLEDRKQVVFMFNPFNAPVMEQFMKNNIDTLREHKSTIAYANHHQLDAIREFRPASIIDIPTYGCSLISFARNVVTTKIMRMFASAAPIVEDLAISLI